MRLKLNPLDEDESFHHLATTNMQLAGDIAHLRSLGDGLFRTRYANHRVVAAREQSKNLLAQIELAERRLRRK